ncbi:diacylglycerol/lipid kinase family protein [Actinoplanes sichuanensis]|uniref:Diacylglycerol/lipid kinase family protein n=1 Tax=Actinoplanes sichuanensis TaxID=512349 RepID=A0ABW4ASR0_9ACTN|nr:diacylglycerol kinase family protein [Actinoplanes sichuanensis]
MDRVAVLFNARSGALLSRAGTVLAAAEHLRDTEVPLGILPGGTMNVLARDLGVPADLDLAVAAPVARIDMATVNGRPFLCSSMLAMMPHLGRIREQARGRRWRSRWRLLERAVQVVRRYPRVLLRITVDGREHRARTRTVVVSCNPLSAGPPPMPGRERLDAGLLAVYVTQEWTSGDLLAVAARLFRGDWQQDRRIQRHEGRTVRVASPHMAMMSVMSDGEIARLSMPLTFEIRPRALAVLMPGAAS